MFVKSIGSLKFFIFECCCVLFCYNVCCNNPFSGRYLANNLKKAKALKEKSSAELQEIILHQPCKLTISMCWHCLSTDVCQGCTIMHACDHFRGCKYPYYIHKFTCWPYSSKFSTISNCDHRSLYRTSSFTYFSLIFETVFILLTANRSITPSLVAKWKMEEIRLVSSKRGIWLIKVFAAERILPSHVIRVF